MKRFKIGRMIITFKWMNQERKKTYKELVADNFNYTNQRIDELAAKFRNLGEEFSIQSLNKKLDIEIRASDRMDEDLQQTKRDYVKRTELTESLETHKNEIQQIKDTLKTITLVLDGLTKRK